MRKIKFILLSLVPILLIHVPQAITQTQKKEVQISIQTSAQCEKCKKRIEEALAFEAGIKNSDLDLKTKKVTVVYNPSKTTPEKIKKAISMVGYDADDVKADPNAYKKLPNCCRKPDDPDAKSHK